MNIGSVPFDKIIDGSKTIESRLYDEKRQKIEIGDEIEFHENGLKRRTVRTKVISLHNFDTFADMVNEMGSSKFGWIDEIQMLNEIYKYYTKDDEKKYSVLGIEIKKIS
ncbi:MAG: ASCH domain-containing protein [Patescibacteria group bacterium]